MADAWQHLASLQSLGLVEGRLVHQTVWALVERVGRSPDAVRRVVMLCRCGGGGFVVSHIALCVLYRGPYK